MDGECSWEKFSRGELLDSGRESSEEKNGVLIRFTPDEAMFPNYAYKMEHLEQMVRNYTCVKVGLTMTFNGRLYWSENGLPDWIAYNIPQMPLCEPVHLEGEDIELVLTHYDGMHIRMLLVTFFLKSYIELIKAGHLYILKNHAFSCQDEEAESLLLQSGGKGHGSG